MNQQQNKRMTDTQEAGRRKFLMKNKLMAWLEKQTSSDEMS